MSIKNKVTGELSHITTYDATTGAISDINVPGNVTANGDVTASHFIGDGYNLSNLNLANATGGYGNSNVAAYLPTNTANVNAAVVTATLFSGNGSQISNINISNIAGSYANSNVAAYLPTNTANVNAAVVTATLFSGNGSQISNINISNIAGSYSNSNVSAYLPTNTANVNAAVVTATLFSGNGSQISNINISNIAGSYANSNVAAYLPTNTASINAATVTATLFSGNGSQISNINISNIAGSYSNSNVTAYLPTNTANVNAAVVTATLFSGNGSQISNINISNIAGSYSNSNVAAYLPTNTASINAATVTATLFSGNGSQLTNLPGGNITGAINISPNNLTAGNATFNGNVGITGNVTVSGNLNYQNVTDLVVGDPIIYIGANNTADLVELGMVASYNPGSGELHTGIARDHNTGTWRFFTGLVDEPTTTINWANTTAANLLAGFISGDGGGLSNIRYSNVIGSYGNSNVAVYLPTYTGNLVSLTGAVTTTANVTANNLIGVHANGTSNIAIPVSNGSIEFSVAGNIVGQLTTQDNVNFGNYAGRAGQYSGAVAIGANAGASNQGYNTAAVGFGAGNDSQSEYAVAIGQYAGATTQGASAIAVGDGAGNYQQGTQAVAVGFGAGNMAQLADAIAIGTAAGQSDQGTDAIAIGQNAGQNSQGANAIAIGLNAGTTQAANSIIINATGNVLDTTNSGFYVNPVRNDTGNTTNVVYYNTTTKELTYGTSTGGSYGNSNVAAYLASGTGGSNIVTAGNLAIGSTLTVLPNTIAAFGANVDSYAQLNIQNLSSGSNAEVDVVVTANNGNDTVNFGDFGIVNSGYDANTPTNSLGNIIGAADTYLYAQGNTANASQSGGNLAIGTTVAGKTVKIFAGGNTTSNVVATVANTGVTVTGNVTANYFLGNGSQLTGISATSLANGTSNITIASANGNIQMYAGGTSYLRFAPSVSSIAIGQSAGGNSQAGSAIAIGSGAGQTNQKFGGIGIGVNAGGNTQSQYAVAIGQNAGTVAQGLQSVAIGQDAGSLNQANTAVAIGYQAGTNAQSIYSVAIGIASGYNIQGSDAIAIGQNAGYTGQSQYGIAIGKNAANVTQGNGGIAIGVSAGSNNQGRGIAIGFQAAPNNQSTGGIAIGTNTGYTAQGGAAVAIGSDTASYQQGAAAIAIGQQAAGNSTVAQGSYAIAIGSTAGYTGQSTNSVAIGTYAANVSQGARSVAIGYDAGRVSQGGSSIAIGEDAANASQGLGGVAIGYQAGANTQGAAGIAIGTVAGSLTQGVQAIAIGNTAGSNTQGANAIAMGYQAGRTTQGARAIAIGGVAGQTSQGINSIAIGYLAGNSSQAANSIILNASGTAQNGTNSGFYVNPVREDASNVANVVFYNASTKEVSYANTLSIAGNISTTGSIKAGTTITSLPNMVATFGANVDSYAQINFQNLSNGSNAESDFVLTADNGSDTVNYGVLGLVNSAYDPNTPTNSIGNIIGPADTFLYAQGNTGNASQSGGNLAIGTTVAGKTVRIFAGGNTSSAVVATIANTGVTVNGGITSSGNVIVSGNIGTGNISGANNIAAINFLASGNITVSGLSSLGNVGNVSITGGSNGQVLTTNGSGGLTWTTVSGGGGSYGNADVSLYLASGNNTANIKTTGNISAGTAITALPNTVASFGGNVDSYLQINLQNLSAGSNAESDFVITANNGNDTVNYTALGLVNSGYDRNSPTNSLGNILYPVDSFLYAQGNTANTAQNGGNLVLGTTTATKNIKLFAGGVNDTAQVAVFSSSNVFMNAVRSDTNNISSTVYFNTTTKEITYGPSTSTALARSVLSGNITLALSQAGSFLYSTSSTAQTVTIPTNANVAFPIGSTLNVLLNGTGSVQLIPASGVSLYLNGSSTNGSRTVNPYGIATLLQVDTNVWFVNGTGVY